MVSSGDGGEGRGLQTSEDDIDALGILGTLEAIIFESLKKIARVLVADCGTPARTTTPGSSSVLRGSIVAQFAQEFGFGGKHKSGATFVQVCASVFDSFFFSVSVMLTGGARSIPIYFLLGLSSELSKDSIQNFLRVLIRIS